MWWLFRQDGEQFTARGPYVSEEEARLAVTTGWIVAEGDNEAAAAVRAREVMRRSTRPEPPAAEGV